MKNFFALALAVALFISPVAMAGELSSADSDFLFSTEQVASTTISAEEMTTTAGQGINVNFSANGNVAATTPIASGNAQAKVKLSISVN